MFILFENLTQKQTDICALVLSASIIPYRITRNSRGWDVWVNESNYQRALSSMEAYFRENRKAPLQSDEKKLEIGNDSVISGLVVCLLMLLWYLLVQQAGDDQAIIVRFGASASHIIGGEYYRAVTALMLHNDEVHLSGNMVGLFIFGTAVCTVTGWGLGWLMVLISGVAGNLINAFMYESAHLSIGASTAVFGAIGILAGYQGLKHHGTPRRLKAVFIPMACGLALLGLLGSGGEHIDIMAHLFGFFCGIVLGGIFARLFLQVPGRTVQWLSAASALIIVFAAWWAG